MWPAVFQQHEVTIEPYLGRGAYGDTWGPGVAVRGFTDHARRVVRSAEGSEVVSESTFYAPPGTVCPTRSRVTFPDGRRSLVIAARDRDGGALPVPSHVEIACQ